MKRNILITNNPMIAELIKSDRVNILFFKNLSYFDMLNKVRDLVHVGHKLLTHPIVSSIKPDEMPYKTVLLTEKEDAVDIESLSLIDSAIEITSYFKDKPKRELTPQIDYDFRLIDYNLISGAINNIL